MMQIKIRFVSNVPMERCEYSRLLCYYLSNVPTEHSPQFDFAE